MLALEHAAENRRERLEGLRDPREDSDAKQDDWKRKLPATPEGTLPTPRASDLTEDEVSAEGAQRAGPREREDPARLRAVQDDGPGLRGDRHRR